MTQLEYIQRQIRSQKAKSRQFPFLLFLSLIFSIPTSAQDIWDRIKAKPQTLETTKKTYLENDIFKLGLLNSSHTVASLNPKVDLLFDFVPSELLDIRSRDSLYHLGDINLMYRFAEGESWKSFSSAHQRELSTNAKKGTSKKSVSLVSTNLRERDQLAVTRTWEMGKNSLILSFELKNESRKPVEIGYLGVPMIFDNILHKKSLEDAHLEKVFYDPYIGGDAGYLQVVRLHGKAPVLLVIPKENAAFEAYSPLLDDQTPRNITFEGFHDWVVHSKAKAEGKWKNADQWIEPSSVVIAPGESYRSSLEFLLADDLRSIEPTLVANDRPVAVGLPGYVVPIDVKASLRLKAPQPIKEMTVSPKGALTITKNPEKDADGWLAFDVEGKQWGRAKVEITYLDGTKQVLSYKVIDSETELIEKMGSFLTKEQWYENEDDPFGRHNSVISYDYEKKAQVVEDSRVWIAGLSDEAGAGSWLAAFMKQLLDPNVEEVEKLGKFMHETLWGGIQYSEGENKYGVKKSVFYYEPEKMPAGTYSENVNYGTWAAWDKEHSDSPGRSYNYPHVAAAHWIMYRLLRYHEGFALPQTWDWYLESAFRTSMAMVELAPHYAQFGQMEGTVFLMLLDDLKNEGMESFAKELEGAMKARADVWSALAYPFGSEMPWDSTGQEEVYMWTKYFGMDEKADVTLNAILAYMPTVPHWGYNGSARRYWDFQYGGKIQRIERQLHHYGSALNAIPVMQEYIDNPEDLYLLRVGYAGMLGGVANVTEDGFGPAAFHSYPEMLAIDPYSGDYGSGFFGYAVNSKSILLHDKTFGWLGFGGNVQEKDGFVKMALTSAGRKQLFLATEKLLVKLESGNILEAKYDPQSSKLHLFLDKANAITKNAYFRISHPTKSDWDLGLEKLKNGAYILPLGAEQKELIISLK
ncbi:DUF5695 domain-containing protein [Belliella sp. DSM 107340]|uniref:DUF5695 domain-containing protein n=1 Tax=Belliella calami TaxID=2923436 RepID=A0ABS9UIL8_9BACT|nr:DUF5695 domain-containing protein [Belliella calami]MCH7396457.1 DUF5695 domain-containing protein [Belliella calami]